LDIIKYLEDAHGIILSDAQRQAVLTKEGLTLLLAVPGAGKTTVITARLANLILNCGVSPDALLTLTYNKEAARDMRRRWDTLFSHICPFPPVFSTLHAFCYRILKQYAASKGSRLPQLIESDTSGYSKNQIIIRIYREICGEYLSDDMYTEITSKITYAVNMMLPHEELALICRDNLHLPAVFSAYRDYKRANGLMDFDDMLLFALTALKRNPNLRAHFRGLYEHISLDEAQDTSKIQLELLELLINGNLFMVGDEDQSIYGFRGAYPDGMTGFIQRHPYGRIMRIENNYRTCREIADKASLLIKNNRRRFDKQMHAVKTEKGIFRITSDIDMADEYDYIARQAKSLSEGESCAVLYRDSFTALSAALTFRRMGIPYYCRGTNLSFITDPVVKDLRNYFSYAADTSDFEAFSKIYYRLNCGISRGGLLAAEQSHPDDILKWIIENYDYNGKSTGRLSWCRRIFAKMSKQSPEAQTDTVIRDLDYLSLSERKNVGDVNTESLVHKLICIKLAARGCSNISELFELLASPEKFIENTEPSAITLSTIHSAKGREFDRVIIADALDGIVPQNEALLETGDAEEEIRLFYTAMTRARNSLEIITPTSGLKRRLVRSRFLEMMLAPAPASNNLPSSGTVVRQ